MVYSAAHSIQEDVDFSPARHRTQTDHCRAHSLSDDEHDTDGDHETHGLLSPTAVQRSLSCPANAENSSYETEYKFN